MDLMSGIVCQQNHQNPFKNSFKVASWQGKQVELLQIPETEEG